jgi:hypothetical protein
MNFVAPGGTALAAVELPETGFANTDFSSAFFSVSVHKDLTAGQCTEFAVPQTNAPENSKIAENSKDAEISKMSDGDASEARPSEEKMSEANVAQAPSPASAESATPTAPSTQAQTETPSASAPPVQSAAPADPVTTANTQKPADQPPAADSQPAPLDFKAMQPGSTEAVSGEGTRQSDSRYFHVFQNGSCYEFALNVTTNANGDGLTKHVDRDKVFSRLEKILDTVKLESPSVATEAKEEVKPESPVPTGTPAQ